MALLRRCTRRLLCVQTRFIKLREKSGASLPTENHGGNKAYVEQLQIIRRPNFRHASHAGARQSINFKQERNLDNEIPTRKRSMRYAEIKKIISEKNDKLFSDPSAALRLLENCRDMYPDATIQERRDLIHRTWNFVEKLATPLTVQHYNTLLVLYAQNRCIFNAQEFLSRMEVSPDLHTYRLLLEAVAEIGDRAQSLTVVARIEEAGYPLDEAMFNALLLSYSIDADMEGAQDVLSRMEDAMIEPSSATYCALSRGFAAKGDIQSLRRVLKTVNLSTKQSMAVVKTLVLSGHGEGVFKVMEELGKMINAENDEAIRVIVELIYSGKGRDAFRLIDCFTAPGVTEESTKNFADLFLYEIVKADVPMEEIFEICNGLLSSEKKKEKKSSALLAVTEAALRLKKEDGALLAFEALRKNGVEIRPHFYWPLLVNAAFNKLETDLIRLLEHMVDEKVDPDYETLRHYVIPFLSVSDPVIIIRKLQDCRIQIPKSLTPVLTFLLDKGDLGRAVDLTHKIKGKTDVEIVVEHLLNGYELTRDATATAKLLKNINFNSDQIGKFLFDLLTSKRIIVSNAELTPLLHAFEQNQVKISRLAADAFKPRVMRLREPNELLETIERLIDHERSSIAEETYGRIPHPRVMTSEQLENHLLDLKAQGMNTRGVLRRLIQVYCSKNNLKKAEEFSKIFTNKGFEWSAGMICNMFSLYAANGLLDEADIRYIKLTELKDFKIDDHKILDYATALVKKGKLERALEVLNAQKNVRTSPEIVRNCWRLLNAVAATGNPESTKKTLNLLIEKKYCEVSNHVLAPLIRTHLINGEMNEAVSQLKECAFVYKKVPLTQELLRALLDAFIDTPEAIEQIGEVLNAVKQIHGTAVANTNLIMALAVKNRRKELEKLITISKINEATVIAAAKKLADERNSDALIMILNTCRGAKKLDTSIIYNLILDLCSRSNDHETALKIWEMMKIEEINPSARFIEDLKNLLKSQRIPLPLELRPSDKGADD